MIYFGSLKTFLGLISLLFGIKLFSLSGKLRNYFSYLNAYIAHILKQIHISFRSNDLPAKCLSFPEKEHKNPSMMHLHLYLQAILINL